MKYNPKVKNCAYIPNSFHGFIRFLKTISFHKQCPGENQGMKKYWYHDKKAYTL